MAWGPDRGVVMTRLCGVILGVPMVILVLSGCSQFEEPSVDHSKSPALQSMTTRISQIGGPEAWEPRTRSVAVVDPTADRSKTDRRDTDTASVELLLNENNFEALAGWDSPTFDASDPEKVTAKCSQFTEWLLDAAAQVKSSALELQNYWTDDCRSNLAQAEGEQVWFVENSGQNPVDAWFVGGLITRNGDDATLTAVVGVKNVAY